LSFFICVVFFFFNDTATTEIYTLSLHDALPISHELSHIVKKRLMQRYPQIADAIIHIEPPPELRMTNDERRMANDGRRITNDERRMGLDERRMALDERRTASDERRITNDERGTTRDERRTTKEERPRANEE